MIDRIPFKVTKNQAYRLNFSTYNAHDLQFDKDPDNISIIKDGGAGTPATNSVQHNNDEDFGLWFVDYLDLTADEMNADIVMVQINYTGAIDQVYIIETGTSGISMDDEIQAFVDQDRDGVSTLQNVYNLLYKFLIKNANRRV